jgi:hypothetical protein
VIGVGNYIFECSPAGTTTWTTHNLTTTSIAMSGLLQGTTYNMRVLSVCNDGTSSPYTTGQFSTISDIICAAPASVTISNITSSAATATWPTVAGGLTYVFEHRQLGSTAAWSVSSNLTSNTYNFGGLLANTTYETRVKTNCNGISSTYSNNVNFSTGNAPVSCPDSYEANTKATSLAIPINGVAFQAKLTTATDQDWYKFNNTSTAKNVRIIMSSLPANYNVKLLRGNSQVGTGGTNTGTLDEKIVFNNTLSATTFYVQVTGVNGAFDANACYNLSALISATALTAQGEEDDVALREDVTATPVVDEFLVFPNPAQGSASVLMPMQGEKSGILRIMDTSGKILFQEEVWSDEATAAKEINLENTSPGMYILSFVSGQNVSTTRLVVER